MARSNGKRDLIEQSRHSARSAGLKYVSDQQLGIHRRRKGRNGFSYFDDKGKRIGDEETLHRIRLLAIPPAWEDVWIAPTSLGHVQATGRDARGRKQYRYHDKWRQVRDENKYGRLLDFAKVLPAVRRRVSRDLKRSGLCREKVLAAVVAVLEKTFIRVGNDEYARQNDSYGLTTLRDRHVRVNKSSGKVLLEFRGKSGKGHAIEFTDSRLARIVAKSQDLPGQELFQYLDDDGKVCDIGSADVNAYLRQISGQDFTAKDFRTWAGTVLAARALARLGVCRSKAQIKRNVLRAIESVAECLGNTRAVCRKCYIHPDVFAAYAERLVIAPRPVRAARTSGVTLRPEEAAVVALLRQRLAKGRPAHKSKSASSQKRLAA